MFGNQKIPNRGARPLMGETGRKFPVHMPFARARLPLFLTLSLVTVIAGSSMMYDVLSANGTSAFELVLLSFFVINFGWISISFWTGCVGFFIRVFNRDPLTLARHKVTPVKDLGDFPTAVVMPVYNEDVTRSLAGFEASLRSLVSTGHGHNFDFYLLSDSQNEAIKAQELKAWQAFEQRLGPLARRVFYRNRTDNRHRKVGNIADFCERWGQYYQAMLVLDADSVMTGECMVQMAKRLKSDPEIGLVQTVPTPVRQETLFGRFLQFAAGLCSPMLSAGLAFWQTDNANYWGHNAIIRISAFRDSCGLPTLPGKAPFGGEVLSHDFVEAALMRRAGWKVVLDADLKGSYEEVPGNMLDYAARDRRWLQGNLQHLGLLNMSGITLVSRLHLLLGGVAYLSSLFWMIMLMLSTVDAIWRAVAPAQYFTSAYQLFPDWPVAKTGMIFSLLTITVAVLLLPKLLAAICEGIRNRQAYGGWFKLSLSLAIEVVFAMLIAPIMMFFHACFVLATLAGKNIVWNAQPREARLVPWREAFVKTWWLSLIAILWAGITAYYSMGFFLWLLPVVIGLIFAAPIIRYSSSGTVGQWLRARGLFLTPEESAPERVLLEMPELIDQVASSLRVTGAEAAHKPYLKPALFRPMPVQQLFGRAGVEKARRLGPGGGLLVAKNSSV